MADDQTPDSVAAAQADIERTREQLQETVDQLSDRLDPRVRAKEAGEQVKATAAEGVDTVKQNPVPAAAVAGAVIALIVAVVVLRRRRRPRF